MAIHVGQAAALLTGFALVFVITNYSSLASPNLYISQLHCYFTPPSIVDTGSDLRTSTDQRQPRVALCLVGGARAFELTAESILRHLIDPNRDDWTPDVFLHAPLDADAHKFTLLRNISARYSRLASARIFLPEPLPESGLHRELLNVASSPNGMQGLLQYFNLVEGCLDLIAQHEDRHGFRYDWVVRTRVDGFWAGPIPPLPSLNASVYYVPIGSRFSGFNDRFGLGSRNATVAALSRLSLLPLLHKRGHRMLNSEKAFRAQLKELQIPCKTIAVPFCILSRRKYNWPITGPKGVPVASIGTVGALNGAKCRPCTPAATGSDAERAVSKLSKRLGWPGHIRGLALCNATGDWEENWQELYAEAVGRQFEQQRKRVLSRNRKECEADVVRFAKLWETWDAPPAQQICSREASR